MTMNRMNPRREEVARVLREMWQQYRVRRTKRWHRLLGFEDDWWVEIRVPSGWMSLAPFGSRDEAERWIWDRMAIASDQPVQTQTELYVHQRDVLEVLIEEKSADVTLGDALGELDADYAMRRAEERAKQENPLVAVDFDEETGAVRIRPAEG